MYLRYIGPNAFTYPRAPRRIKKAATSCLIRLCVALCRAALDTSTVFVGASRAGHCPSDSLRSIYVWTTQRPIQLQPLLRSHIASDCSELDRHCGTHTPSFGANMLSQSPPSNEHNALSHAVSQTLSPNQFLDSHCLHTLCCRTRTRLSPRQLCRAASHAAIDEAVHLRAPSAWHIRSRCAVATDAVEKSTTSNEDADQTLHPGNCM